MESRFKFNKKERSGIFFLLLLVVVLQLGYLGLKYFPLSSTTGHFKLDTKTQKSVDSLVLVSKSAKQKEKTFFNPNYITDYKGYMLGLSAAELDRLHQFRASGKFVNSVADFKKVTGVSDSLLAVLAPQFRFPDWVKDKKQRLSKKIQQNPDTPLLDLNAASAERLRQVHGIGEKLSVRIVKFRDRLGGFLVNEQLYHVYGLDSVVAKKVLQEFTVKHPPEIKLIPINTATAAELATLVYLKYHIAENIVNYRTENGMYLTKNDLFNVPEFPINKIDIIALYLSF